MIHRDPQSDPPSGPQPDPAPGPRPAAGDVLHAAAAAAATALRETGPRPERLAPALRRVCHAQPAAGSVLRLVARALEVAEAARRRGDGEADAARAVLEAVAAFAADCGAAAARVASQAAGVVPAAGWVAAFGRAALVERALLEVQAAGRPLRVLLSEARPLLEGRGLARRLSAAGVPCWLTTDAAAALLLPQAGALLVAADAVLPRVFLHRPGGFALLLAARESNVPAYALAPRARFVPAEARLLELGERGGEEVWEDAPAGVSVRNPGAEEIPLALVRGVITEDAVLPPGEAGVFAAGLSVPEALHHEWGKLPGEK